MDPTPTPAPTPEPLSPDKPYYAPAPGGGFVGWWSRNHAFVAWLYGAVISTVMLVLYLTGKSPAPPPLPDPPPPVVQGAAPESADAAATPRGRRLAYTLARHRAARKYAGENGVSAAYADALVAKVSDDAITAAAIAAGVPLESIPQAGPLANILDWLASHRDLVERLVELILALLPLFV